MKYLDEYRDPDAAKLLLDEIRRVTSRPWTLMEVCGGQTHSLLRHGIASELEGTVELIHGPGCPVCVTDEPDVDFACQLAQRQDVVLASFGDMLRVPGRSGSLLDVQTTGAHIRTVYSPLDAVKLARQNPEKQIVFFAVGFETTAPATALAIQQADQDRLENFSMLVSHVRVQPAMEMLLQAPENRVQAFLAAGHVCTVMGYESYDSLVTQYRLPVVVTGFEPLDLLEGILACVRQLEAGAARLENQYARLVKPAGNRAARDLVQHVYQVCDRSWRGFGVIPNGGLELRPEWRRFDARRRFTPIQSSIEDIGECQSYEIMTGHIRPPQCPHFGKHCTPESPLGAPMVSSEGACAAYYHFAKANN
ncbi:MAG: hydrogenase formation protein HypD [Planctomycetaceae bacterium]|nr:hydrogenase formation protein HypD [Planctomycetaceae bacterium]